MSDDSSNDKKMEPVHCSNGHWNDPYPDDGKCVRCGTFLPRNPFAMDSDTVARANRARARKSVSGRDRKERVIRLVEEAGYTMENVPELLLMYAEAASNSDDPKDYNEFSRQTDQLKANPKASNEPTAEQAPELIITAETVDHLKASLDYLREVSGD